ncbi:hypothetical protein C0992_002681, partial [Termitomyces sp. T32_za158]
MGDQFDEFSTAEDDEELPELITQRDEIGLVHAIVVKERSSAKQKQLFVNFQGKADEHPCLLLGDMPVQWSSTYVMLNRAEKLQEYIEPFLHTIAGEEKDHKKRLKLGDFILTKKEWNRVSLFLELLTCAKNAQQAFSTDQGPTLHFAIPALEALHSGWSKCHEQARYKDFVPALDAALQKIKDYYDKTAASQKAAYLHKHWSKELMDQALAQAEETYKVHYIEVYSSATALPPKFQQLAHVSKIKTLLCKLSDLEDEIMSTQTQ